MKRIIYLIITSYLVLGCVRSNYHARGFGECRPSVYIQGSNFKSVNKNKVERGLIEDALKNNRCRLYIENEKLISYSKNDSINVYFESISKDTLVFCLEVSYKYGEQQLTKRQFLKKHNSIKANKYYR